MSSALLVYGNVYLLFCVAVSAKGFDYDGLYVHFFLDLPTSKHFQNAVHIVFNCRV